ncbi:MAG: hypothetical protein V5A43_06505 [Haloarculaceae archaeon]
MSLEETIEESLGSDATVERTTGPSGTRDGTTTFTIRCEPGDEERIREKLPDVEADIAFAVRR